MNAEPGRPPVRCAIRSELHREPLAGTASTYRGWVLLEQPGPWGKTALTDSRLPGDLGARLRRMSAQLNVRVLLIRRHGNGATSATARRCYVAHSSAYPPVLEQCRLTSPEDVLGLDFAALARGESLGLDPVDHPLFLVCTHGKHDACCAERGRPVAKALSEHHPEGTWECSHMGGDRFAGNMLVLPEGLYYGRLTPENAVEVARDHTAGQLTLDLLRGRCAYPFPAQAAEIFLRRERGVTGVDAVRLDRLERAGQDEVRVWFSLSGQQYEVRVASRAKEQMVLSCDDETPSGRREHELVSLTRVPPGR